MVVPTQLPPVTLILGGARSGKSDHAQALVEGQPGDCVYIATALPGDAEMAERIRRHRARRGGRWRAVEVPLDLTDQLGREAGPGRTVLVDCLTLWLANLMAAGRSIDGEQARLIDLLPRLPGPVVLVSNEVGLGIVPDNAMARTFGDHAGRLHQAIAQLAESVIFMIAGLPQALKSSDCP